MQEEAIAQNLYELPSCTICLQQMHQDLSSLACGHIFHIQCITQYFEYRGTCPCCQKRAVLKEIRPVFFSFTENPLSNSYLKKITQMLDGTEAQKLKSLLKQMTNMRTQIEQNKNRLIYYKEQQQKKNKELNILKSQNISFHMKIQEIQRSTKDIDRQRRQLQKISANLQRQNNSILQENHKLRTKAKQLQHYRTIQKVAESYSQQILNYRNQLQNSNTPPQIMAKSFFDMLQLKNLALLKGKQKIKYLQQKNKLNQQQIRKYREQVKKLNQKINDINKVSTQAKIGQSQNHIYSSNDQNLQPAMVKVKIEENIKNQSVNLIKKPQDKKINHFRTIQKPKSQDKISFGHTLTKKKAQQKSNQISIKNFMLG